MTLDITAILRILPHRYPFLLIDKVLNYGIENGHEFAECEKMVSYNEQFFQGHFVNEPIMPGVLIVEALAQASGIAIAAQGYETSEAVVNARGNDISGFSAPPMYFVKIESVVFRRKVVPGDVLNLYSRKIRSKLGMYVFETRASVSDQIVTEALLTAMVAK